MVRKLKRKKSDDLDDVLFRFHCDVQFPTQAIVEEWVARYPQFEADIRDHARIWVEEIDARGWDKADEDMRGEDAESFTPHR